MAELRFETLAPACLRWSLAIAVSLAAACSGDSTRCAPLAVPEELTAQFADAVRQIDWEPEPPCTLRPGFAIAGITVDRSDREPRLNFFVSHRGDRSFSFSQTRSELPFRAIPQGTHRINVGEGGPVLGSGFAGPSGGGESIGYLRWRSGGITFELAATFSPSLGEAEMISTAAALIAARD